MTGERSLPALEAAHIRAHAAEGPNRTRNGLLLRADIHRLFDDGYVTVDPDLRFMVNRRLHEEFENGRVYYALDGGTPRDERRAALARLRRGELRAVFAVDLFNEGVDLPEVDTVLLLRPTESATVFLQQLGRGLRWAEGKRVLTVLDLVGQVRREYRYDVRYRALLGGTRHQVQRAVEADFPLLPPGCALKLDPIAKETVLRNLRDAVRNARARLADDLRTLGPEARLGEFMRESGAELQDIYAKPQSGHCFVELRRRAGFSDGAGAFGPRDPLSSNPGVVRTSFFSFASEREMAGVWRFRTAASAAPTIAAMSRNAR